MTFEIEVAGRARAVAVERIEPDRFRVVLDGQAHVINAARIGDFGLSLLLEGEWGASREIQVVPADARGDLLATIDGRTVPVGVNGRRLRRGSTDAAGAGAGDRPVLAPMPGRVVRVLVGPGDEVTARQPLVVVEAMKMENELRSPRAGTVKEVTVSAGMSVDAGRVLVTIA